MANKLLTFGQGPGEFVTDEDEDLVAEYGDSLVFAEREDVTLLVSGSMSNFVTDEDDVLVTDDGDELVFPDVRGPLVYGWPPKADG